LNIREGVKFEYGYITPIVEGKFDNDLNGVNTADWFRILLRMTEEYTDM
jgi:hypothetical protein